MNESEVKVPKFRSARRALEWLRKNRFNSQMDRLPPEREEVFFKDKSDPSVLAGHVLAYSRYVCQPLGERFEELLKPNKGAVLCYIREAHSRGQELNQSLVDELKGSSNNLYHWACHIEQRLPKHLEDSIEEPLWALKYAKDVLRGRLPKHLEKVFFKSAEYASQYAFEVIRGFSPIKLPDDLHAFMVMKSFETPNNRHIKEYMEACEDDPNKMGNHSSD